MRRVRNGSGLSRVPAGWRRRIFLFLERQIAVRRGASWELLRSRAAALRPQTQSH
jgi:hypothetical protein